MNWMLGQSVGTDSSLRRRRNFTLQELHFTETSLSEGKLHQKGNCEVAFAVKFAMQVKFVPSEVSPAAKLGGLGSCEQSVKNMAVRLKFLRNYI